MSESLIVTGLLFGDEGKGVVTDQVTTGQTAMMVVKSSGGAQNAHNVMHDGKHHTFAQVGSGGFNGCPTYLSEFFVMNPSNLWRELQTVPHLSSALFAHPMTVVTTEYHRAANRAREDARGDGRHGSTAQGIGEAIVDSRDHPESIIRACMLTDRKLIAELLHLWRMRKRIAIEELDQPVPPFFEDDDLLRSYVQDFTSCPIAVDDGGYLADWRTRKNGRIVFEGGQGTLLDEHVGFFPHVCWGRTTPVNAFTIADKIGIDRPHSIGIMRSYMTRHGAGPLPTEADLGYTELHNGTGKYQGPFRQGYLDLMLLDYALTVSEIDTLAVNHLDSPKPSGKIPVCVGYEEMDRIPVLDPYDFTARTALTQKLSTVTPVYEHVSLNGLVEMIEERSGLNVRYAGYGPQREHHRTRFFPTLGLDTAARRAAASRTDVRGRAAVYEVGNPTPVAWV